MPMINGKKIKALRQQNGWSFEDLATKTKANMDSELSVRQVEASTIWRWENGKVKHPSWKHLKAVAETLGVEISDLFIFENEK